MSFTLKKGPKFAEFSWDKAEGNYENGNDKYGTQEADASTGDVGDNHNMNCGWDNSNAETETGDGNQNW